MPFEMLTKDEAAERARISRRKLDMQIRAGTGPVTTLIGARRLVRSDMLAEWLERCTQPQPARARDVAVAGDSGAALIEKEASHA